MPLLPGVTRSLGFPTFLTGAAMLLLPLAPFASGLGGVARAQSADPVILPGPASTAEGQGPLVQGPDEGSWVVERVVRDRWLHEGQHPGFVAFTEVRDGIRVEEVRAGLRDDDRMVEFHLGNLSARLFLDARNRVQSATVDQPPVRYTLYQDEWARAQARRRGLTGAGPMLRLPWARFWEVLPVLPEEPLQPGASWSDTLSFLADPGEGLQERLEGIWEGEVVGDTVLDGRRLPLVRQRARIRYRSREFVADWATDEPLEVSRDLSGTMVAWAAVDPQVGVRAAGADTTFLEGTAVLRMGPGREFPSGIRYERERSWLLHDSVGWDAVRDSLRAETARQRTGMLAMPPGELEERLGAGDRALADSLLGAWREAEDPNLRRELGSRLSRWYQPGDDELPMQERLRSLRLEAGDTAGILEADLSGRPPREPWTRERLESLLPYLDDPGRLWRLGVLPAGAYADLTRTLLLATPILEPDPERWGCEPAACEALLAIRESADEPRLRDAALVGAWARDPARWNDSLAVRAEAGFRPAREALRMGRGVGATWPAAPGAPVPETGAEWRTWLEWLGGTVRWGDSHERALRMYAARTGRDPVEELLATWPPQGDSAQLVVGTVLQGMDALETPSAEALRALVLSGGQADLARARRTLARRLVDDGVEASPPVAARLLGPLLDSIAARGDSPWPALHDGVAQPGDRLIHRWAVEYHGVRDVPLFLLTEGLPAEILERVPDPLMPTDRAAWDARPLRAGGALVTFEPVRHWDGFVRLGWSWTVRMDREEDEAPGGYAGGGSLVLIETSEGWKVVSVVGWIT